MTTKIINLIISAGWHEGELSVADDIQALYSTEMDALKRKLREAEDLIKKLSKDTPIMIPSTTEVVEIPSATDFLKFFSIATQREHFFNNMVVKNWAVEAMEGYINNYYLIPKKL